MKATCEKHHELFDVDVGCTWCDLLSFEDMTYNLLHHPGRRRSWIDLLHTRVSFEYDILDRLATLVLENGEVTTKTTHDEDTTWRHYTIFDRNNVMLKFSSKGDAYKTNGALEARKDVVKQVLLYDMSSRGRRILK